MSKTVLLIVGILVILIGIAGLVPSWTWAAVATWLAIVEIIIGVIAAGVSLMDKKT